MESTRRPRRDAAAAGRLLFSIGAVLALVACGGGSDDPTGEIDAGEPDAAAPDAAEPDAAAPDAAEPDAAEPDASVPPEEVDYDEDVQAIFDASCTSCHPSSGGLDLSSYADTMSGGNSGDAVVPCECDSSILWQKLLEDPPFGSRMPQGGPYLDDHTIETICVWIDEGAEPEYDPDACS